MLAAMVTNLFLAPHKVVVGGAVELAVILYQATGIPISLLNFGINLCLLIPGLKLLGCAFTLKTLFGAGALSIFSHVFSTGSLAMDNMLSILYPAWYGGHDAQAEMEQTHAGLKHHLQETGNDEKPLLISEFGGGAIYGEWPLYRAKWTQEYQSQQVYHCPCNYIPGIARDFDMGDLGGLIAPRKLVVEAGQEDPIFPIEGTIKVVDEMKQLYHAAGADGNVQLVIGSGGQRFYADAAYAALHAMRQKA